MVSGGSASELAFPTYEVDQGLGEDGSGALLNGVAIFIPSKVRTIGVGV